MRKRLVVLLAAFSCCLLIPFNTASTQSPTIQVSHVVAPVNQLSISDIDFRHSTTPKWLFTINIAVTGVASLDVEMVIQAGFTLPDYRNDMALRIATEPFTVSGTRSISNLDFDRSIRLKPGSAGYQLDNIAKQRLEETALPTGQIPAGTYTFNVRVASVDGTISTDGNPPPPIVIVISNPTTVELISPIDGDPFSNQFPLFQWLYDGPSSRISIFEKLPGQSSLEEAASGVQHYSAVTASNSLQYPSAGVRALEPGKTYVWFVEGLIGAAGGTTITRKSSLRSFTVSNGSQSFSTLLDELARALPKYQELFDEIKAQGFTTAGSLRLNGSAISVTDLQKLLNTLRLNPDAVGSVEFE